MLLTKKYIIALALIAVILVSVLSLYYLLLPRVFRTPVIAVVKVYGYLITDSDRELYIKVFEEIRRNDTYRGVVILVNSPGGYASIVEEIYFLMREVAQRKPLIVVIDGIAASGGYYVSLASDYIIASPTSFVGNIGAIALAPSIIIPSELILESGPYKYTGFSYKNYSKVLKVAAENFVNKVLERREGKIKVSKEELLKGKLYPGTVAKAIGLVDELGGLPQAIAKIRERTGIRDYVLVDVTKLVKEKYVLTAYGELLWKNSTTLKASELIEMGKTPLPVLYLSPYWITDNNTEKIGELVSKYLFKSLKTTDYSKTLVIDLSHRNLFIPQLMTYFWGKLIENNIRVLFVEENLASILEKRPLALMIFTPARPYSEEEVDAIIKYLSNGGKLILVYDPAYALPTYLNELSIKLGLYFAEGYLYDMYNHYGIYRNIKVSVQSDNSTLLKNIHALVLFTASQIYCNESLFKVQTYNTTVHSFLEEQGYYTVIVVKKNTVALGDSSFLLDPYLSIADNKKFVENLVQYIRGEEK